MSWWDHAACRGHDPELWFPGSGGPVKTARAICAGCTVREQCRTHALNHGERHGIWGGLSERERRQIRQKSPRCRVPNCSQRRHALDLCLQHYEEYLHEICEAAS